MDNQSRPDEMRIIIQASDALDNPARPIPAKVFKSIFSTLFDALKAADAELHEKKHRSEFFISHLAMGSNVFGVSEQRRSMSATRSPSIDLVKQSIGSVYRSDFSRVVTKTRLAKSIIKIGKAIDSGYPTVAYFPDQDIPLDSFFARQADRLKNAISPSAIESRFFAGSAVGSFDGRLGSIDYRGATWVGNLMLPGHGVQIECVFNRSLGEDAFNPYGNKRVSVTGRAIYTGDSQLPERIEVMSIDAIPLASKHIDIRGSLIEKQYFSGWDSDSKNG